MITYKNLEQLHTWLTENWLSYKSMIEGGSVAAGDPLVEGRSDWEIAIVADKITPKDMTKLQEFLKTFPQDDRVELVYRTTEKLLLPSNDMHYLTGKFRSKTLFGENLIDQIPFPDKEVIEAAWINGLKKTIYQIDKYLVNSSIWSDEKIRRQFRPVFKNIFMNLQIKAWGENGEYPVTRKGVIERYPSTELNEMWEVLHGINTAGRQKILDVATGVKRFIEKNHRLNS